MLHEFCMSDCAALETENRLWAPNTNVFIGNLILKMAKKCHFRKIPENKPLLTSKSKYVGRFPDPWHHRAWPCYSGKSGAENCVLLGK